ncbi:GNAT family N-acetyltransferase [Massilia sp. TS11]|uniref:GNAT family N-acetyltransferase n=1 Tax=Massilia sp. TS11 TaxID=2908003 RepID=UPI001EDC21B3|nr:GNAT family N-acetyltransferase [Massilia sp. TS11]MCG2582783.1 GNAT family N-acetyltransferase [Massilia sp. TS11]
MPDHPAQVSIDRLRAGDVVHVFNLILQGSDKGHFTPLYLEPRYAAGLGMQLFCLLTGWLRLPGGEWLRGRTSVVRIDGLFVGFLILLHRPSHDEIYMTAVDTALHGYGLGRLLIQDVLHKQPPGRPLRADCLPASACMQRLLAGLGFERQDEDFPGGVQRFWRV